MNVKTERYKQLQGEQQSKNLPPIYCSRTKTRLGEEHGGDLLKLAEITLPTAALYTAIKRNKLRGL
jgi:hypothetical protein